MMNPLTPRETSPGPATSKEKNSKFTSVCCLCFLLCILPRSTNITPANGTILFPRLCQQGRRSLLRAPVFSQVRDPGQYVPPIHKVLLLLHLCPPYLCWPKEKRAPGLGNVQVSKCNDASQVYFVQAIPEVHPFGFVQMQREHQIYQPITVQATTFVCIWNAKWALFSL